MCVVHELGAAVRPSELLWCQNAVSRIMHTESRLKPGIVRAESKLWSDFIQTWTRISPGIFKV